MSDQQDTDRLSTVSDRPRDRAGVDVATAARQLGISHDAIRGRLRRKSLAGELQPSGQWVVYLDAETDDSPPTGEQQAATGHRQATDSHATALIEALQADVEFLRTQLDQKNREQAAERERFDIIHREALQRIEALTSSTSQTDLETRQDDSGARMPADMGNVSTAYRSWWRRLLG